jgi:tetratricopeptide (TPR) repeat protein
VLIKFELPGAGTTQAKTDKKGEWALGGIARGAWHLDFEKPGYETARITVSIEELSRVPPIETKLKASAPDANAVIQDQLVSAAALLNEKKFSEARAIYEGILAKYPQATQVEPLIARTYYGEKQYDKAIEHLKIAVEKNPSAVENKLLLGNILIEQGRADEGRQILASVDDAAVKDPTTFVNVGIGLLNQNRPDEALTYFEKAIARFPQSGDAYYYRALVRLQKGDTEGAKTDLKKFLEISPNAPEAPAARKALEQIK